MLEPKTEFSFLAKIAIVLALGIGGGALSVVDIYFEQFSSGRYEGRRRAAEKVRHDSKANAKKRFLFGSVFGVGGGIWFLFIRKRED